MTKDTLINTINKGKILLEGDYLYLANTGKPFTREGILALLYLNLSTKHANESAQVVDKFSDIPAKDYKKWFHEIRELQIRQFAENENLLRQARNEEGTRSADQKERWVLEILQNFDDAMGDQKASEMIGNKGIGFAALLNIGSDPEVFSGTFQVSFNREQSRQELEKHRKIEGSIPQFCIPHEAKPDDVTEGLLKQGFVTVIRLRVRDKTYADVDTENERIDDSIRKKIITDLNEQDSHFLLFSQHLEELEICTDGNVRCFRRKITRSEKAQDNETETHHVSLQEDGTERQNWLVWRNSWLVDQGKKAKRQSVMLALPLDRDGQAKSLPEAVPLYNFYRTSEDIGLRALLHITFKMKSDRERMISWEDDAPGQDEALIEACCDMIAGEVINHRQVSAKTILRVFSGLQISSVLDRFSPASVVNELRRRIFETIKQTQFIAVLGTDELCRPAEAKIWPEGLDRLLDQQKDGLGQEHLVMPELNKSVSGDLVAFGAIKLDEAEIINVLKYYVKNASVTDCLAVLKFIEQKELYHWEEWQTIPIFMTGKGQAKAFASEESRLTEDYSPETILKYNWFGLPESKGKLALPSCVPLDFLHPDIEKWLDGMEGYFGDNIRCGLVLEAKHILTRLLPHILEGWTTETWNKSGPELLNWILQDNRVSSVAHLDKFRLPAKRNEWVPASELCFTADWGLSKALQAILEQSCKPLQTAGEISKLLSRAAPRKPAGKTKKSKQQRVSKAEREKRRQKIRELAEKTGVRQLPEVKKIPLLQTGKEYQRFLRSRGLEIHRGGEDFTMEGLPGFLDEMDWDERWALVPKIIAKLKDHEATYLPPHKQSSRKINTEAGVVNFGIWQLSRYRWIKSESLVAKNGWVSPHECYVNESGHKDRLFPNVPFNKGWRDIARQLKMPFFSRPDDPQIWTGWLDNLKGKHEKEPIDERRLREVFTEWRKAEMRGKPHYLPAFEIGTGRITFLQQENVFWNDLRVSVDTFEKMNGFENHGIFILDKDGSGLPEEFKKISMDGVSRLLTVAPESEQLDEQQTKSCLHRVESYWDALLVACGRNSKDAELSFKCFSEQIKLCSSINLRVGDNEPFSVDQYISTTPSGESLIKYDEESEYRFIAKFLATHFFKSQDKVPLLQGILASTNWKKVKNCLIDAHIDPQKIKDLQEPSSGNDDNGLSEGPVAPGGEDEQDKGGDAVDEPTQPQPEGGTGGGAGPSPPPVQPTGGRGGSGGSRPTGGPGPVVVDRPPPTDEDRERAQRAEECVADWLEKEGQKDVEPKCPNNEGYDIKYKDKDSGETHFVEVKSTKAAWDNTGIGLTPMQMKWAIAKGAHYHLYVVEFVDEGKPQKITVINDPFAKLKKGEARFILKASDWREFGEEIWPKSKESQS